MKVYVKKEEKDSNIPRILITLFFLGISIYIFSIFFKEGNFMATLERLGDAIILAAIFFFLSIYFIYAFFKKPKFYKVILKDKKEETYNGMYITCLGFAKVNEKTGASSDSNDYCYTIGSNDLVVGKFYRLSYKEFNWEPRRVEEYNESGIHKKSFEFPFDALTTIFGLFFIGNIILGIIGLICYPQYAIIYLIWTLAFMAALFYMIKNSLK